jgi:hypothetical protein
MKNEMTVPRLMDDVDGELVRDADEEARSRIWAEWVSTLGYEEASRRWLSIFGATDAPRTG